MVIFWYSYLELTNKRVKIYYGKVHKQFPKYASKKSWPTYTRSTNTWAYTLLLEKQAWNLPPRQNYSLSWCLMFISRLKKGQRWLVIRSVRKWPYFLKEWAKDFVTAREVGIPWINNMIKVLTKCSPTKKQHIWDLKVKTNVVKVILFHFDLSISFKMNHFSTYEENTKSASVLSRIVLSIN